MTIAVFGSPGSGKTTLAVKIANELSRKKRNVMLVTVDCFIPTMDLLTRNGEQKSIGKVLDMQRITPDAILRNCNITSNKYLTITGYAYGENELTYTGITLDKGLEFIEAADGLADELVIDCTSNALNNQLTGAALLYAHQAVLIFGSDIKTVSYYQSNKQLLMDKGLWPEHSITIMNDIQPGDPVDQLQLRMEKIDYFISHEKDWHAQFIEMGLTDDACSKATKKTMEKLVANLVEDNRDGGAIVQ